MVVMILLLTFLLLTIPADTGHSYILSNLARDIWVILKKFHSEGAFLNSSKLVAGMLNFYSILTPIPFWHLFHYCPLSFL